MLELFSIISIIVTTLFKKKKEIFEYFFFRYQKIVLS